MKMTHKWERARIYQSKPYVIYGYAAIPQEKKQSLMLDPMYISANSGLIVSNNASLNINGSKSNSTLLKSCLKAIDFSLNMPMFPDNGGYGTMEAQIIPSTI
jgi:hypothetical protein